MENTSAQTGQKTGRLNKAFLILLPIAVVFLVSGGLYLSQSRKAAKHVLGAPNTNTGTQHALRPLGNMLTPIPLNNRQKQQLAQGTSTTTKKKLFEITCGNYYFTPNSITVNQGDMVTIMFFNLLGIHDFVIDSLHVKAPVLRPGLPGVVTFTVDKKGTYEFTSSIAQDRRLGMKGTLVVR